MIPNIPLDAEWEQMGETVDGYVYSSIFYAFDGDFVDSDSTVDFPIQASSLRAKRSTLNSIVSDVECTDCETVHHPDETWWSIVSPIESIESEILYATLKTPFHEHRFIEELNRPGGLFIDHDQTMIIADCGNHRILRYMIDSKTALVVAGGNGRGNQSDQLNCPTNVLIDKETDSLIICDSENRRVVQWSQRDGTTQGETLNDHISCRGLAMDDQRYLYISDTTEHEVRRYQIGDKKGVIVAGGNGNGSDNNKLNFPTYLFVDRQQSVYVSDYENHRVMKWDKDAQKGIAVAGNRGEENEPTQLAHPEGLFVDTSGSVYVADSENHRVMRWPVGATKGTRIAGGNGEGNEANQFNDPAGLSFDQHNNLYVVDKGNNRVQRFPIK